MTIDRLTAIYDRHFARAIETAESERNGGVVKVLLQLRLAAKREIANEIKGEKAK